MRISDWSLDVCSSDLVVAALAQHAMADPAMGVDEIQSRPGDITEGAPDAEIIVDRHRIMPAEMAQRLLHIAGILPEGEFRRMHADHHQAAEIGRAHI